MSEARVPHKTRLLFSQFATELKSFHTRDVNLLNSFERLLTNKIFENGGYFAKKFMIEMSLIIFSSLFLFSDRKSVV